MAAAPSWWDIGTYDLIEGNYYKGRLHVFLEGKKLNGEWLLSRDRERGCTILVHHNNGFGTEAGRGCPVAQSSSLCEDATQRNEASHREAA
jgi:hypothetical protein